MKVSLFLGAGASTSYFMPTPLKLKEDLAEEHAEDEKGCGEPGVWQDLLSTSNVLDMEHVLPLADTVDGLNRTAAGRVLIGNSGRLGLQLEEVMRLGRAARREVFRRYAWDHDFDESADGLLGPLMDMAVALNGNGQVAVFTTNYDRAVEEFCKGRGLRMRDGFSLDTRTGRRMWAGNFGAAKSAAAGGGAPCLVKLYKLHGSLDWKRDAKHGILRVDYDGLSESANYKDALLHPSLADKSAEIEREPYNGMHDSFRKELASSNACMVVGFSFRDGPIAAAFRKYAELDGRTLIVVGPSAREDAYRRILGQDPPGGGGPADT